MKFTHDFNETNKIITDYTKVSQSHKEAAAETIDMLNSN